MGIATLREPVLSSASVRSWTAKGAAVTKETADSCFVTFTASNDTTWTYAIDTTSWLIKRLVLHSAALDSNVFDGSFFYRDSGGIPLLEKIALMQDTTLHHGGYKFYNQRINQPIPDSMFTIAVLYPWTAPGSGGVKVTTYPSYCVMTPRPGTALGDISIFNAFGRVVFRKSAVGTKGAIVWRYTDGNGTALGPGRYFLRGRDGAHTFTKSLFIRGKF
jgi:hypothetical protein